MFKRIFDIVFSLVWILLLLPLMLLIALIINLESKGGFFYFQKRVGRNNVDFMLIKFRTMCAGAEKKGLLTVGSNDNRITKTGRVLRKLKLDELPQLLNILIGDMSIVGPRPEVRKYVNLYTEEQKQVLTLRPGLSDYASIEYFNENEVLAKSSEPEKTYIEKVMPHKLELNLKYINKQSFFVDLKIIFKTIFKIFS